MSSPTTDDFKNKLEEIIRNAKEGDQPFVDVESGQLHRLVGGYPAQDHRMPSCCGAMKQRMRGDDKILSGPDSDMGATLRIRYGTT